MKFSRNFQYCYDDTRCVFFFFLLRNPIFIRFREKLVFFYFPFFSDANRPPFKPSESSHFLNFTVGIQSLGGNNFVPYFSLSFFFPSSIHPRSFLIPDTSHFIPSHTHSFVLAFPRRFASYYRNTISILLRIRALLLFLNGWGGTFQRTFSSCIIAM